MNWKPTGRIIRSKSYERWIDDMEDNDCFENMIMEKIEGRAQ